MEINVDNIVLTDEERNLIKSELYLYSKEKRSFDELMNILQTIIKIKALGESLDTVLNITKKNASDINFRN